MGYRVLLLFIVVFFLVLLGFTEFFSWSCWVFLVLPGLTRYYLVLSGFMSVLSGFFLVLPFFLRGLAVFKRVLLGFTGFLLGFTDFFEV